MGSQAPLIRAQGLRLGYGISPVLNRVDLTIQAGEFWFLLGPNGTGKSTLIKVLLGRLKPQAGQLQIHPALAGHQGLGLVPQNCGFNPSLPTTVREFVLLGLVGIRVSRRERVERLCDALDRMGLSGMAKYNFWTLSGGQRQRALVARALIRRPMLLIMDEPTNGLDIAAETALLEYIAELNRTDGLTVLCVSHNLVTAARHGSHVAFFHDGQAQAGPIGEILSADRLRRVYGVNLELSQTAITPVRDNPTGEA